MEPKNPIQDEPEFFLHMLFYCKKYKAYVVIALSIELASVNIYTEQQSPPI